jgi:hypothetical protein
MTGPQGQPQFGRQAFAPKNGQFMRQGQQQFRSQGRQGARQPQSFAPQQFGLQGQGFMPQNQQFAGPQGQQFSGQGQQQFRSSNGQFGPQGQGFGPQGQQGAGPQGQNRFAPSGQEFGPQGPIGPQGPQGQDFGSDGIPNGPQGRAFDPRGMSGRPPGQQSFGPQGLPPQGQQFGGQPGEDFSSANGLNQKGVEDDGLGELAPADRVLALKQRVCPITGQKLGEMGTPVKVDVKGRPVFVCCEGCKDKLLAQPDKFLAKIPG